MSVSTITRPCVALALLVGFFTTCQALTFDEALRLAATQSPAIEARAREAEAADSLHIPAGELPDPKLVLGIDNFPVSGPSRFDPGNEFMSMARVGVMQDVPNKAKRKARTEAALAQAEVARDEARIVRQTAVRETALAWLSRETAERQLAFSDALLEENKLLAASVRAGLAGGKGGVTDIVMPRREAAMIENLRDALRAQREQAIAALRRWIGASADVPLTGGAPGLPLEYASLSHDLHKHPELEIFASRSRESDAMTAEARAELKPDWSIEAAYQKRDDSFGDMVSVQVAFDLPLFAEKRQNPRIAARAAERAALDAEFEATRREHAAMLEADFAEYRRLNLALKRQRDDLIPLAREKVDLAMAAWRGGRMGLNELVAARRERIEAELKAIELEGAGNQLAARLRYTFADPVPESGGNQP